MGEILGGSEAKCLPLHILLVEDNEADVKITMRAFQNTKLPNQVFAVSDGQECLDYLRRTGAAKSPRPDLILLDINLPRLDGFGVLADIKADPFLKAIPVIILSASKNDDDVVRSYQLGANSFIQKPVAYEQFVTVVEGLTQYWQILARIPERKK